MKTFYHSNLFKSFLFLSLNCIMGISQLFGQATIQGVVRDAGDKAPLIAVNVFLKGTSTGTVTDYNGEYLLTVPEGDHVIEVMYLGYEAVFDTVSLKKGQAREMDYDLKVISITGDEIVVTAQARGQLGAVNEQVNSDKIVNVVSSERIKEFPDDNAAQSISRLPGVHLSGSSVVIRGIQPKMNKILINGVEMPSTDPNNRAVGLDMISSNSLAGIEVFKTITPDMDADAVGGVVNLRLQEAPKGQKYSFMVQDNFNSQEKTNGYKIWTDYSNRYLGDKLGVALNLNYNNSPGGYDEIRVRYEDKSQLDFGDQEYMFQSLETNDRISKSTSYGGNLMLDYKVGEGKVIVNSMLTNKESEQLTYTEALGTYMDVYLDHNAYSSLLWNNLLQFDQQIGRVKLNTAVSYIKFNRNTDYNYNYHFASNVPAVSKSLTDTYRAEMDPWEVYDYVIDTAWMTSRMKGFSWEPENYCENKFNASFDIEAPFVINVWFNLKLKAGGKYKKMYREYDAFNARYGDDIPSGAIHEDFSDWLIAHGHENWESTLPYTAFRDYDYQSNGGFMGADGHYLPPYVLDARLMDEMAINLMDHEKLQKTETEFKDDYWGGENLYAGYIMGEINLWDKLLIIPGIRYESLTYDYSALKVATPAKNIYNVVDTLYNPVSHAHILPHLHARLKATDWFDVRFSYNKTLTRPDYSYVIPKVFYNTVASSGEAGNPFLKPAISDNLDLSFSFHADKLGLITVGAFNKKIDGIFYPKDILLKNIPDSSVLDEFPFDKYPALKYGTTKFYVNNQNMAYLKGIELEWQSNLSYLPAPFNGLVLNANYTRVWSETDYPYYRVAKEYLSEPPYIIDVEDDTVFHGGLIDQAKNIGNVSVGYDYKGFSVRLSFRFQGNVISNVSSRPEEVGYTQNSYKFDLALKQQIPVKFARMEAYFNAVNFTNVPYSTYNTYLNKGETTTRLRYSGPQFQLGIRLRNKLK